MPQQQTMQLRFKQIAVGGPDGTDLYGLTDTGEVYVRAGNALSTQWLPLNIDAPVRHAASLEFKAPTVGIPKAK